MSDQTRQPVSLPEAVQWVGALITAAGLYLAIYTLIGRLLLSVKPRLGLRFAAFMAGMNVDIVHNAGRALGQAVVLMVAGFLIMYAAGRWARRRGLL